MFSRFMNQVKLNKLINKQHKLAKQHPDSGYSAIIGAILEQEAKGTFIKWPVYMRNTLNEFYANILKEYEQTEIIQDSMKDNGHTKTNEFTLVISAVSQQAIICKDLNQQEILQYLENNDVDNLCKVLVNMKLLPTRFLNDEIESGIVV
jgi:hypothetical protein